ncbi:adenosylmethionine decarboxylase [Skermania sp. ID1734]|uniref:adenosylmethionine decarboxylase n=1 Tax=Skermania sp. ID1734 TaxID=2597516 RepID=UPI001180BE40|nr:adenosylmethionine decarboxylase [Skermania sp. ID1734]TSE01656.1 adenosylmethionine decarboxylase [Skermania sp. ID1734]
MNAEFGAFAGSHVLAEFDGIDSELLDSPEALETLLHTTLTDAGATVCGVVSHRFEPQGVTVLAMLAESHASIHTYPERGSAFADVFTCGHRADPRRAVELMSAALGAATTRTTIVPRGLEQPRLLREPVGDGLVRSWQLDEVLFETDTDFQNVVIGKTAQGISLFCDAERQSTEATQLIYHEALMMPGFLLADQLDRVLIIGSSEGVASQLSVAAGATIVDHVDIDTAAVRACAEYLPYGYTRTELAAAEAGEGPIRVHYRDGWEFLAEAAAGNTRYDLVVIDLPDENDDPDAQHNRLYGTEFLERCAAVTRTGGVVATQAGCPTVWRNQTLLQAWQRWTDMFGTVAYFGSDEHEWAFFAARVDPITDHTEKMVRRLETLPYQPKTMDAETVRASAVPPYSLRSRPRARA